MNIKLLHGLQFVSFPLSTAVLQALVGSIILPKDLIHETKWCHQLRAELEMSHTRDKIHQRVPESAKKKSLSFCKEEQNVGNDRNLFLMRSRDGGRCQTSLARQQRLSAPGGRSSQTSQDGEIRNTADVVWYPRRQEKPLRTASQMLSGQVPSACSASATLARIRRGWKKWEKGKIGDLEWADDLLSPARCHSPACPGWQGQGAGAARSQDDGGEEEWDGRKVWGCEGTVWGREGMMWGCEGTMWGHEGMMWGCEGTAWGCEGMTGVCEGTTWGCVR